MTNLERNITIRSGRTRTILLAVSACILFAASSVSRAHGGLLLEDRLDGASLGAMSGGSFLPDVEGQGWHPTKRGKDPSVFLENPDRIEYPLEAGTNFLPDSGTLRLKVRYLSSLDPLEPPGWSSTLVDFLNPDDSTSILVYAEWGIEEGSRLNVWGPTFGKDVYGFYIPLGFRPKTGETVDLAFTWGPDPVRDNKVFINGKEASAYLEGNDGMSAKRDASLGKYLSGVDRLRIGIDSEDGRKYPGGRAPAVDTVFDLLQIYDRPMTPAELGMAPEIPTITSVTDDTFEIAGISGKLVAGDMVTAILVAVPGGQASFDMGDVKGIAMEGVPATEGGPGIPPVEPGTYRGTYTILPGDDYEDGRVVGRFVSADNVFAEPVTSDSTWTIDTKPVVTFRIDKKDLPADSVTKTRIKLVAKDANGNPVAGRHLKLTLSSTEEYTGTVGAGDFGDSVGASVESRWRGETDAWGEVEFDYLSGFAAKTVILSAKDLDSGGVAVDYITAFKEAAIDIALTPPISRAAARRGIQYIVKVEASRTELTADGRSRSAIRAKVLDPDGRPVAGDPVAFTLSSENGTLRTIKDTTDSSGMATAEYVAGKQIGIVVVTATATLRNAQGNVSITLLSDAPAKIYLKARPEALPADGFSRADLDVKVTDINDNPNADTKVEFRITKGGGKLDSDDLLTDRFGDASNRYTAGTAPGTASIVATVRSRVPTEAELGKAKNVLFVPYSSEGDEIRVEKWLKRKGDSFTKGDPLVEYTIGRSSTVYQLTAPFDGSMGEQFIEYWDRAEVGQTLAVLVPVK